MKNVYSCSMPNRGSWSANFSASGRSCARVLVTCGVMSGRSTSHITSTSSPPRMGSGNEATGESTQSELAPGAWFVLEPSKPQIGSSAPSCRTLVLERSRALGSVPSIQMYSALYDIDTPRFRQAFPPLSGRRKRYRRPFRNPALERCMSVFFPLCERRVTAPAPPLVYRKTVRTLSECSSSSTTSCGRSRSGGSASSACGSPTSWARSRASPSLPPSSRPRSKRA